MICGERVNGEGRDRQTVKEIDRQMKICKEVEEREREGGGKRDRHTDRETDIDRDRGAKKLNKLKGISMSID